MNIRELIRFPLMSTVRMSQAEWKALVARGKRRLSDKHEAGRVRSAWLRVGKESRQEVRL